MDLDLQLEMLNERGYVLLPGVLEPLRIALLRCAIAAARLARREGRFHPACTNTDCSAVPQRCLAQRRSQSQPGSRARHAASALRQAHGRAEVLAVLELAFQPSGAGRGNAPAEALAGRP